MINAYKKYLEIIHERMLKKYFNQQKDYIFCKEGCSHCCEKGQYPFSALELKYLMLGYNKLSQEEKDIIQQKIEQIITNAKSAKNKVFLHECPFLINKKCSVYDYRGIICRTHGLLFFYQ